MTPSARSYSTLCFVKVILHFLNLTRISPIRTWFYRHENKRPFFILEFQINTFNGWFSPIIYNAIDIDCKSLKPISKKCFFTWGDSCITKSSHNLFGSFKFCPKQVRIFSFDEIFEFEFLDFSNPRLMKRAEIVRYIFLNFFL